MRSSDWSSDVCSSDLDHDPEPFVRGEFVPPAAGQPVIFGAEEFGAERNERHGEKGDGARPDERDIVIIVRLPRDHRDDLAIGVRLGRRHCVGDALMIGRSEEHTSELQSLMRSSYAVFCLKKKKKHNYITKIGKS